MVVSHAQHARGEVSTTIDRGAPASARTDSGLRGSPAVRWWVLVVLGMAQLMVVLDAQLTHRHAEAL